jgi:hypothetical protein
MISFIDILNEDRRENFLERVKYHINNSGEILSRKEIEETYGLTSGELGEIIDNEIDEKLHFIYKSLVDREYTTEYAESLGVKVGGYDFSFVIQEIDFADRYTYTDDLSILDYKYEITSGTVTLLTTGDEVDLLNFPPLYEDIRWEIDMEISDFIYDFIEAFISKKSLIISSIVNRGW